MVEHKVEKLPLINDGFIVGLISIKDIENDIRLQRPNKDSFGRLRVGAAIGAREEDFVRAKKLVDNGVDVHDIDENVNRSSSLTSQTGTVMSASMLWIN